MNLLALIPIRDWLYIAAIVALAGTGAALVHHEREIGAARVERVRQAEHAAAAAVAASAAASAGAETQRREAHIQEIVHATQDQAARVAADAAAADRERDALRLQLAAYRAAGGGAVPGHPAAAASSAPAGPGADVLADLLQRAVDRDVELARIADERGVAGSACERYADTLTR